MLSPTASALRVRAPRLTLACCALLTVLAIAVPASADEKADADGKPTIDPKHPLAPALEHAYRSRRSLEAIEDYEAVFSKRERINGRLKATTMNLKLREKPFSVYLKYVNPNEGREVVYVQGRNGGMLLAHDTGIKAIAGTVSLAPDSEDAMEDNRYPITLIGMRNLIDQVIGQWEEEGKYGEIDVKYYPNAKLSGAECKVIESVHPQPRKQFKFKMTRLFLDKQTNLPVRVEQYAFPAAGDKEPPLVEEYTYSQLRTNVGLTDRDFDTKNSNYAFP